MGLFGFGKKKADVPSYSRTEPKIITRNSEYGPIIDFEKPQDLPKDGKLLFRTGLAYWNGAFGSNLKANMDVCRRIAVRAFNAIYNFGLEHEFPEAGFYISKYFWKHKGDVDGVSIDHKACTAHMCRHYILKGPEVNHLQEAIMLYLYHFTDGMEQVILWLRERVERDMRQQSDPLGLVMLRHYLILRRMAAETRHPYDPLPYKRLAEKYQLVEALVQHVSLQLLYNGIYEKEHTTKQSRDWLRSEAYTGNPIANQIIFGVGIDRVPYEYQGAKTDENGRAYSYRVGMYHRYYERWEQAMSVLKREAAQFRSDWFVRETEKADRTVAQAKQRHEQRQSIAENYACALYLYACGHTEEAVKLMCRVEAEDASWNAAAMRRHGFRLNLSPAASWWLSRHTTEIYDRTRQYGFDENGSFAQRINPEASKDAWSSYELWNAAEEQADQLRQNPNAEGFRQFARLVGEQTPYWEPLPALSKQIRMDVLAQEGIAGLGAYILDEPDENCLRCARALICDPDVNKGDPERVRIGWLVLANRRHLKNEDVLTEAIEYVNRYFDCHEALGSSGLSVRYVTQLAAQDNEMALRVLGELYMDYEEVNHGDTLLQNLGHIFYRRLSTLYEKKWKAMESADDNTKAEFLHEWYQLEHVERRDADLRCLNRVCIRGINRNMVSFFHTLTRKPIFLAYMEAEGRQSVKLRLKAALDAGYKSVEELYNKMDQEDRDREYALQCAEEARRKAMEEEFERNRERRRKAFNARCDDIERAMDLMRGGSGLTSEEQALAGKKSYPDHLRDRDARNNIPNIF